MLRILSNDRRFDSVVCINTELARMAFSASSTTVMVADECIRTRHTQKTVLQQTKCRHLNSLAPATNV